MPRRVVVLILWVVLAGAGLVAAPPQGTPSPKPSADSPHRLFLNRYCVTCHNERLKTADVLLDHLDERNTIADAATWEKVIRQLRGRSMPPVGAPRPDAAAYDSTATYLEMSLDRASAVRPNPGRTLVRRLNRSEYTNVVRDLLGVEVNAESLLPPDDSSYGFDNISGALSLSPSLFERYLSAARKVVRLAMGSPLRRPDFKLYEISSFLSQDQRMSDSLPFGSRGGIAIRHLFPLDGEYVIKVKFREGALGGTFLGFSEPHQLDIRLDGARVEKLTVGGPGIGENKKVPGEAGIEVRTIVKSGTHSLGAVFLDKSQDIEGALRLDQGRGSTNGPAVSSVSIEGPFNAKGPGELPSRQKVFICTSAEMSNESDCAKKIITRLVRRAFRRPVLSQDVEPLLHFYSEVRRDQDFDGAITAVLEAILVTPDFLFRIERDPPNAAPGEIYRVGGVELASRLSFFLWSSMPDEQLLDLGEQGKLSSPLVLQQQISRMLADPRSKALVSNFAGQWLLLRNLRVALPDSEEFPEFDENLREAFHQETELFVDSVLRADRSVLDLLNADYTFVNERLARHYGIANVFGSQFRRVPVTAESRRGLLGKGSLLTVTSYAARTSPVLRGKWLLENFLGTPPPPPPPNIPSLKDRNQDGRVLSLRQILEQHRSNPVCSSCHARMDPLGFALENFDAIGRWRETSGVDSIPVDSSGVLPDGTRFQGPDGLRKVLLSRPDRFVATLAEKLMTYALGRGIEYYDAPAVRVIVQQAGRQNYKWSSLIVGIVNSTPFQMKRAEAATTMVAEHH